MNQTKLITIIKNNIIIINILNNNNQYIIYLNMINKLILI